MDISLVMYLGVIPPLGGIYSGFYSEYVNKTLTKYLENLSKKQNF